MSRLTALKDKDPKDVARLLSVVAGSLLPNPAVSDVVNETGTDPEFVKIVLSEIRARLRVREGDRSIKTQSQIYAFLSQEISKATLSDEAASNVKTRLGNRGELHPSQYEVRFPGNTLEQLETIGERKNNIIEAITRPDKVVHFKPKYLSEDRDPRITISSKFIAPRRVDDEFILLVFCIRSGYVQHVRSALRVYRTDVNLNNTENLLDVITEFTNSFGVTSRIGHKVFKLMLNETITFDQSLSRFNPIGRYVKVVDLPKGHTFGSVFAGGETNITSPSGGTVAEVVLSFAFDLTKYMTALRRHHVDIKPDAEERLAKLRHDSDENYIGH
jgi:hypothetical protein